MSSCSTEGMSWSNRGVGEQDAVADEGSFTAGTAIGEVFVERARAAAGLGEGLCLRRLPFVYQSPSRCSISPPFTSRQKTPSVGDDDEVDLGPRLCRVVGKPDAVERRPTVGCLVA